MTDDNPDALEAWLDQQDAWPVIDRTLLEPKAVPFSVDPLVRYHYRALAREFSVAEVARLLHACDVPLDTALKILVR